MQINPCDLNLILTFIEQSGKFDPRSLCAWSRDRIEEKKREAERKVRTELVEEKGGRKKTNNDERDFNTRVIW